MVRLVWCRSMLADWSWTGPLKQHAWGRWVGLGLGGQGHSGPTNAAELRADTFEPY